MRKLYAQHLQLVGKPKPPREGEKPDASITEKMAKVAPEEEWRVLIMEAVEISANYGRHIDVKVRIEDMISDD